MSDSIEMKKSDFVKVVAAVATRCGPWLPGEEPIPGWMEPDPEACEHWQQIVAIMKAADTAIHRTLGQQRFGESLGEGGAGSVLSSNRSELQQFVDDFCGTPPKWPLPWPPPRRKLDPKGLSPAQLLVAAARFQAAADFVSGNALQPEFAAAADRLFEVGLARLSERRGGGA